MLVDTLSTAIITESARRTTRLSARLLYHATYGLLYEPAMLLGAALFATNTGGLESASRRLFAIGHTSGTDIATGILLGALLAAGAIAQYWHKNQFGFVAGRLYIAWCAAAVGLPVLAGALFDRTGGYASTVWVAAGINVVGMVVAGRLPAR